MKVTRLIKMLREAIKENGDMDVVIMVDGHSFSEIEINCPDSDSPLYLEGYIGGKNDE